MFFCRIEHGDFEPMFGEGLNPKQAFDSAVSLADFTVDSECAITFWEAKKLMNIKVEFTATVVEY